ncbi:TcmI family type II polyketide cyclase [Catenuloplanes atrovinosus]|uniref:Cyclase/tetracenomycin F2 cyclase n=1 Tax=Catenuloplanes atrovinosus TaxID=137266 RepID=A0AAE4C9Q2_9ACTN|nr:TcmI family type II polyketide cyclase [Catenuloplanes atrovinosus]MDR7276791.1 cyclase/tetracenomycin F2 cyclase [Catenuloplanes atrovinosus]
MAYRALMVMRMDPAHADTVAELFREHDEGDMPQVVGISRRTLFRHHDLYLHLLEADHDVLDKLYAARSRPDFQQVNARLAAYLRRYAPDGWTELRDSMAQPFYTWSADEGSRL